MFKRWMSIPTGSALLLGPRRAGKTTLLREAFPEASYVTLDDFDYLTWAKEDPKGLVASLGKFAIIDEIQRVPTLTIAVKKAIDEGSARFLMSGSSSVGLLDGTADTLAGRIDIFHLPTACWGEVAGPSTATLFKEEASPPALRAASRSYRTALYFGGFPEVVVAHSDDDKEAILKRYRDTYFTRDLAYLSNIENIEGLLAILNHAGKSIGSHLEVSNFARESGVSYPTAKKYLNVLTQAELAFKLYGYQHGPAKRYIKAAKLYYADNGIMTALRLRLSEGQWVENFVISELEKRRKIGLIQADQFYYYRSVGGLEVDLVYEEHDALIAIEIKASSKINRRDVANLLTFAEQHDGQVKPYVFYGGLSYRTIEGVPCIPIAALCGGH